MGKRYSAAWKLEEDDVNPKDPTPYLVSLIGSLWTSYGLFILIKHLIPKNIFELLTISVGTWLLIVVGLTPKHFAFSPLSLKHLTINYLIDLIGLTIMSMIIWMYAF